MKLRIFTVFASILFANLCFGQELFLREIENLKNDPQMAGAGIGVLIRETEGDKVVYELNPSLAFVPGSILKLVTSAAALEMLGPDYTFETGLAYDGQIDKTSGILNGNLYIIGGGDPCLGSENFQHYYSNPDFIDRWAEQIISLGILEIAGNIYIDDSVYDGNNIPGTWVWEDLANYYGAAANGLSGFDNTFRIVLRSEPEAGKPATVVSTEPAIEGLELENFVVSSDSEKDGTCIYGSPWGGTWKIFGTMPKGREKFVVKAALPEPGLAIGSKLKTRLSEMKIPVSGIVEKGKITPGMEPFYTMSSPPLKEIVEVMNHKSVNLYAEHLVNQLAFETNGAGTISGGLEVIQQFWKEKGIGVHGFFMDDGSGLSHFNAVTPETIAGILRYMKTQSPYSGEFLSSLPLAGEGTLSVFDVNLFPGETLRCKSGSMKRVRCYAGYLTTASAKKMTFVLMFNDFSMSQNILIKKIGDLLSALRNEY